MSCRHCFANQSFQFLNSMPAIMLLFLLLNPNQRTCEANAAGENSSFIFTVCVKSVPRYHFKLAYVVLQMAVKEFFETHF